MALAHLAAGVLVGLWLALGHRALIVIGNVMASQRIRVMRRLRVMAQALTIGPLVDDITTRALTMPTVDRCPVPHPPLSPPALAGVDARRGPPSRFTLAA
jgi:hypothetical protein